MDNPNNLMRISSLQRATRGMPASDAGLVCFRRGQPRLLASTAHGRNLALSRVFIGQRFAAYTVPHKDWLLLHIPVRCAGTYHFNGREMQLGEAVLASCPSGYFSRGEDRDALTLGIRKSALEVTLQSLSGQPDRAFPVDEIFFSPSPQIMALIRRLVSIAFSPPPSVQSDAPYFEIPIAAEKDIIDSLCLEIMSRSDVERRSQTRPRRASDVVGEALNLSSKSYGPLPSLSELCAATGVGQTRLFECFRDVQGLSPHSYLQSIRLDTAYALLTDAHNPPKSVKDGCSANRLHQIQSLCAQVQSAVWRAAVRDTTISDTS